MDRKGLLYQLNPPQRLTAAADLRAAADLIEKHGWTRGINADVYGHICLSEALTRATQRFCDCHETCDQMNCRYMLALVAFGKFVDNLAMAWNDEVAKDQGHVLTTVRQCADWLDELALVSA